MPHNNKEALLEAFLIRLHQTQHSGGGYRHAAQQSMKLYVGTVPEGFPIHLPFPENSSILGSLIDTLEKRISIEFDSPLTQHQIFQFYRSHCLTLGWTDKPEQDLGPHGGFWHWNRDVERVFYDSDQGTALFVRAYSLPEILTTVVSLVLEYGADNSFHQQQFVYVRRKIQSQELIPKLTPPAESPKQLAYSSSSGDGRSEQQASLETTLTLEEIALHYKKQLEQAGWRLKEQNQTQTIDVSCWRFRDEDDQPWFGAFSLWQTAQRETLQTYQLSIQINIQMEDNPP